MTFKTAIFNVVMISSILLILSCSDSKKTTEKVETPVTSEETVVTLTPAQIKNINLETGTLTQQNISNTLKLSGQIDVPPQNLVSVSIPLGGYLRSTSMLPGTQVRKGQLLAVMEDPQYIKLQQDYLTAKSRLVYASKEYERQRELNNSKATSDKVLQQAENQYRSLNIEIKALAATLSLIGINPNRLNENTISRTINIYSPINGYISQVNVNIGKYVTPSDVIFELVNPTDIHLNVTVYEKDLNKIAIGQRVMAYSNARPDKKYQTEIILVSHALKEDRSAEIHCHFEQYDKTLTPGMYMNAEIQLENQRGDVLPNDAIVNFENKDYVFIEEKEGQYRMTPITKGQSENGWTVIATDLKDQKVVTKGAYSLLMQLKNISE